MTKTRRQVGRAAAPGILAVMGPHGGPTLGGQPGFVDAGPISPEEERAA